MFCAQCGKSNEDGTRFCASCGSPLTSAAPAAAPNPGSSTASAYQPLTTPVGNARQGVGPGSTGPVPQGLGTQVPASRVTGTKKRHRFLPFILAAIVLVLTLVVGLFIRISIEDSAMLSRAKEAYLEPYTDTTLGDAMEAFFSDPKWKIVEYTSGRWLLTVEGKAVTERIPDPFVVKIDIFFDPDSDTLEYQDLTIEGSEALKMVIMLGGAIDDTDWKPILLDAIFQASSNYSITEDDDSNLADEPGFDASTFLNLDY